MSITRQVGPGKIFAMDSARPPLSALLSQTLVAFTIEFDNEAEQRMPHKTAMLGHTPGAGHGAPWLASLVMWHNCMRYVTDEGVTVRDLYRQARTPTNLDGAHRWRYVDIEAPTGKDWKKPGPDYILYPTLGGKKAREVWGPLFAEIEQRWQDRFGAEVVDELRKSLENIVGCLDPDLPDCMPILHFGLVTRGRCAGSAEIGKEGRTDSAGLSLYTLLAKALVAFTLAFESESDVSLAISANILRVLNEKGVPVKEIPVLAGVSKESVAMAEGWLIKLGYVEVDRKGAGRLARLTSKGMATQSAYFDRARATEKRWRDQFGQTAIDQLRSALERLVGPGDPASPLFRCVEPYPNGWRAKVPQPATLPHFPMVLHRGGYPDGS